MRSRLYTPLGVALTLASLPGTALALTPHYRNTLDVGLDDPTLLCNDGSVPIFYVREGATEPNRWVFHLEGGSSCNANNDDPSGADSGCEERWAGSARDKMGSGCFLDALGDVVCDQQRGAFGLAGGPDAPGTSADFDGILDSYDPRNPFAGWTHVYFNYCSSDTWAGQTGVMPTMWSSEYTQYLTNFGLTAGSGGFASPVGAPSASDFRNEWILDFYPGGWYNSAYDLTFDEYTILFNGHNIVDRILDQLSAGNLVVGYSSEEPIISESLSLANATHVLLTGSSAGGAGVRQNLDFVGQKVADALPETAPPALYRGIIEASYTGGRAVPASGQVVVWPALSESVVGGWNGSIARTLIWSSFIDESCGDRTGATATFPYGASPEYIRCGDFSELVAEDDLETPYFARHALLDQITRPNLGTTPAMLTAARRVQQDEIEYGGWHIGQETELGGFYFDCDEDHVEVSRAAFYAEPLDGTSFPGATDTFAEVVYRWLHEEPGTHRASMACSP